MIGRNSRNKFHAYGSQDPIVIECSFKAKINTIKPCSSELIKPAIFHVVLRGKRSLLGRSTASDMGLLLISNSVNSCENEGIFPIMPGVKVKFSVNPNIPPTKNAYYNVPAAYREAARQRLHEMESRGIIEKATSAPTWISGMSAVAKGSNDFRLVVNMRAPNRAINREYYRLPLLDEMRIKLNGARFFSKLDLSNAFYHLELSEESRDLTTFLAEDGMYRFTRLMFGVNCAPEIFQREMARILKDIDNVIVFIDDILIFSDSLEGLRATVAKVLQILKDNNLTLNMKKCEFDQTRLKFLGHELDSDGFHIDHEKTKSVRSFREPTTLEESKRALTRADGWALRLSPYNYDVEYVRGRENIADTSSRLYNGEDESFDEETSPWEIATLEANAVEFLTETDIKIKTSEDDVLLRVISAIESGIWSKDLRKYQLVGSDLAIQNGIVIKTGCAVIPLSLQVRALEVAHEGHPSIAKMKSIMRQRVWWPGMSGDIMKWVESCKICCLNGKPEKPTPMERVFAPKTAWESIAMDFNGPYIKYGGILILVIIDYRSRFIIARPVKSTKFECVRKVLDSVFQQEGYPKAIRTDNGPPFNSTDFAEYCKQRDVTLTFSTPLFPQQNGLAESCMKLINKAMCTATCNSTNYIDELKAPSMLTMLQSIA
ncbi:uncharacterized protein K02A2.6-like [Armigeres subalbatus]|uniref:uncharacterized protein K02A2.6-like n=2 Tax=Armigeres subalbatus TaxID=124917 RepID=UPI002ED0E205